MKTKRIMMAFAGVILTGLCIGVFQTANLGTDPFTSFVTGIANLFHSNYSTFYVVVTGLLLAAVWFVDKHYIGIATIITALCMGPIIQFFNVHISNPLLYGKKE